MEKKQKAGKNYLPPVTDVVEVAAERLLCVSSYGSSQDWGGSGIGYGSSYSGSQDWGGGSSGGGYTPPYNNPQDW